MKTQLKKLFLFSLFNSSYGALNPIPKQCTAAKNNACNLKVRNELLKMFSLPFPTIVQVLTT